MKVCFQALFCSFLGPRFFIFLDTLCWFLLCVNTPPLPGVMCWPRAGVEHYLQPGPSSWLALKPSDCPQPHSLLLRVCQNLSVLRGEDLRQHLAVTWMQADWKSDAQAASLSYASRPLSQKSGELGISVCTTGSY